MFHGFREDDLDEHACSDSDGPRNRLGKLRVAVVADLFDEGCAGWDGCLWCGGCCSDGCGVFCFGEDPGLGVFGQVCGFERVFGVATACDADYDEAEE